MELPVEAVHALYKWCTMDAFAVENIGRVCRAWRAAGDLQLYKELIALRWGAQSVTTDGVAEVTSLEAWRKVYFHRALGKRFARTSLDNVDISEVLGKRLATNAFWLHHSGWVVYSMAGRAMAAKIESDMLFSLGFTAKILEVPRGMSVGSFVLGRAGEAWETDGGQWLVVSRQHRTALAIFCIRDAGFSKASMSCSGSGGVWLAQHVIVEPRRVTSLSVCGPSSFLASVCKNDHGKGVQVRVHRLRPGVGGVTVAPLTCRAAEEVLSVCWIDGSGKRLACGTGGGEVLLFQVSSKGLNLCLRLCNPTRTSRIEGLRFHSDLNLLALLEWRHGSREKGGDLRLWVCNVCAPRASWQHIPAPRARAVGGVGKEKMVTNDKDSCSRSVTGDVVSICDACWHEDSLVVLHRGGSASVHIRVPALEPTWRASSFFLQSPATSSKSPTMIASLLRGDDRSGVRKGCVVVAGESAVLHAHTPVLW